MVTATSIVESAVVNAPLSLMWPIIKLKEFDKFYTAIRESELVPAAPGERETVRWFFDNGTILTLREEEYSVRTIHFLSALIFTAAPLDYQTLHVIQYY